MRNKIASKNKQSGQTLIETLVAIFVLVTGLISALSLAIYSYRSSDNTSKQVIAVALANEGIEGIKNYRDSNWLNDTLKTGGTCNQIGANQSCYQNWLGSLSQGTYAVDFNSTTNSWVLSKNPSSYILNYDSSTNTYSTQGLGNPSLYSRKVDIVFETVSPYTTQHPRLNVTSSVWWRGRTCPSTTDPSTLPPSCKIVLQIYLTNWKNY